MDRTFASFAGWVVVRQAMFLLFVAGIVIVMAAWIYTRSREMAIDEAGRRQLLLAEQTARGIETYYQSIVETLDLIRRSSVDDDQNQQPAPPEKPRSRLPVPPAGALRPLPRQVLMPIFWDQLRDRVSHLFMLDQDTMQVLTRFSEAGAYDIEVIVESRKLWLSNVDEAIVGKVGEIEGHFGSIVCVPIANTRRIICAVVPIRKLERRFLANITRDARSRAMLMDDSGRVMTFNDPALIGKYILKEATDPFLLEVMTRTLNGDKPTTTVVPRNSTRLAGQTGPELVSVQPINLAEGRWWLAISSSVSDVEEVVQVMFRRVVAFASVAIGIFTFAFSRIAVAQIRFKSREATLRSKLLKKEVDQARQIQLAWLPSDGATIDGMDVCGVNRAANHISGDFYNWFEMPDGRMCVLIGDVTGHGMSAAFLMSTTQMLLRAVMLRVQDPGQTITIVNRELSQQSFNGQFVTLLVLAINRQTGVVQAATAGHPPPAVIGAGRVDTMKIEPQLVAGVDPDWVYPTESTTLRGETTLLLYTDGIPDAPAVDGRRFGEDGLLEALAQSCQNSREVIDSVSAHIDRFRGARDLSDDVTMVVVRFSPKASQLSP